MNCCGWLVRMVGCWLLLVVVACGGGAGAPPNTPTNQAMAPAPSEAEAPEGEAEAPEGAAYPMQQSAQPGMPPAPPSSTDAEASGASPSAALKAADRDERPGLGTQFGEDIPSDVRHTAFVRQSPTTPFAATNFYYNDRRGVDAMARSARIRSGERADATLFDGGIVVSLVDEYGRVLPGFVADDRHFAVGEEGSRYAIRVENRSEFTFEVVASVDGLSVIDGRPASYAGRGYLVLGGSDILIEGYRTSKQSVAAFRFGRVSQSYPVKMGYGDRNVGVVGLAFFEQQGTRPVYPSREIRLRQEANPFPGSYAPRPE